MMIGLNRHDHPVLPARTVAEAKRRAHVVARSLAVRPEYRERVLVEGDLTAAYDVGDDPAAREELTRYANSLLAHCIQRESHD